MQYCPKCQANVEGLLERCDCCGAFLKARKPRFFGCAVYELPQCIHFSSLTYEMIDMLQPENPEKYQEFPWSWPKETSLDYTITYEWLHTYNQIGLNGARVDATDLVIAHTVGNTDHVTH